MKYIDLTHYTGESFNHIFLPDDTMQMPVMVKNGYTLAHSETIKKWFVIDNDIIYDSPAMLFSGSFVECMEYTGTVPGVCDVPLKFGEKYTGKYNFSYMPIYTYEKTGEYDNEGFEKTEQHFKIIRSYAPPFPMNISDYNQFSEFEIIDFGTDILSMIKEIEIHTDIKF